MSMLQLALPKALRAWIEEEAARAGFRRAEEFVIEVLHRERERAAATRDGQETTETLEDLPAPPITDEDWRRWRQRVSSGS